MAKPPLSHYSPVFANKPWATDSKYLSYYRDTNRNKVSKKPSGQKQWGRERGLYSWDVEKSLNKNLETKIGHVYRRIAQCEELGLDARIEWAQFLLSQHVRTPTYMRYEEAAKIALGREAEPTSDRVGCSSCGDLTYLTSREWCLLRAHDDDFFVRSDNPVLLTGFVERAESALYYPVTPSLCFMARPMTGEFSTTHPPATQLPRYYGVGLEKGGAHMVNFYFAKAADYSLVIKTESEGAVADAMFGDVLGVYPQPPFSLHTPSAEEFPEAFESLRSLMSAVDGLEYPAWCVDDLE